MSREDNERLDKEIDIAIKKKQYNRPDIDVMKNFLMKDNSKI